MYKYILYCIHTICYVLKYVYLSKQVIFRVSFFITIILQEQEGINLCPFYNAVFIIFLYLRFFGIPYNVQ